MRNPERLNSFYETLKSIHKDALPDWRFGQMMLNFFGWFEATKKTDVFYLEEGDFLTAFGEFITAVTGRASAPAPDTKE